MRCTARRMSCSFDAPCSGTVHCGEIPKHAGGCARPTSRVRERQRDILISATRLLAAGGRLVYGTCTLLAIENRDVVEATLAARPELENVPLRDVLGERAPTLGVDELSFTVAPDSHGTDGFFARVMRRR